MLLVHQTLIAEYILYSIAASAVVAEIQCLCSIDYNVILKISEFFFFCLIIFIFLFLASMFYSIWKK